MTEPWSKGCVVITGGTGLVGRDMAHVFLEAGAKVVLVGSDPDRTEAARVALQDYSGVFALACDLGADGGPQTMIDSLPAEAGPVSVLVNGAGINFAKPMMEVTEADFDRLFSVNVRGAWFASRAVCEDMKARGVRGRVINITSGNYRYVRPDAGLYSATKASLEILTRSLALEYGDAGITVNAVAPGLIEAPKPHDPAYSRVADYYTENSPLAQITTGRDVGEAVLFFASQKAQNITGESLVIDGGYSSGRFDFPRRIIT